MPELEPVSTKKLTMSQLERKSERLMLLSHPQRLLIATCLVTGPRSVGEIGKLLDIKFPGLICDANITASRQLQLMKLKGMVTCRRSGLYLFYELKPDMKRLARGLLNSMGLTEKCGALEEEDEEIEETA